MENSPTPERMSLPAMEPLSLGLRGLVRELRRDSPNLSTRMLDTLRGSIPEYGALGQALAHDVYRVGLRNAELWYDALLINRAEREIEDALVLMKPVASAARMGCMTGSRHS